MIIQNPYGCLWDLPGNDPVDSVREIDPSTQPGPVQMHRLISSVLLPVASEYKISRPPAPVVKSFSPGSSRAPLALYLKTRIAWVNEVGRHPSRHRFTIPPHRTLLIRKSRAPRIEGLKHGPCFQHLPEPLGQRAEPLMPKTTAKQQSSKSLLLLLRLLYTVSYIR